MLFRSNKLLNGITCQVLFGISIKKHTCTDVHELEVCNAANNKISISNVNIYIYIYIYIYINNKKFHGLLFFLWVQPH